MKKAVIFTFKNSNIPMAICLFGIQKWKDLLGRGKKGRVKIRISVGWSSGVGGGIFRKVRTWWWLPGKLDGAGGIKVGPSGYRTHNQRLLPLAEAKKEKNRNTKRRLEVPTHDGEFRGSSLNAVSFIWSSFDVCLSEILVYFVFLQNFCIGIKTSTSWISLTFLCCM